MSEIPSLEVENINNITSNDKFDFFDVNKQLADIEKLTGVYRYESVVLKLFENSIDTTVYKQIEFTKSNKKLLLQFCYENKGFIVNCKIENIEKDHTDNEYGTNVTLFEIAYILLQNEATSLNRHVRFKFSTKNKNLKRYCYFNFKKMFGKLSGYNNSKSHVTHNYLKTFKPVRSDVRNYDYSKLLRENLGSFELEKSVIENRFYNIRELGILVELSDNTDLSVDFNVILKLHNKKLIIGFNSNGNRFSVCTLVENRSGIKQVDGTTTQLYKIAVGIMQMYANRFGVMMNYLPSSKYKKMRKFYEGPKMRDTFMFNYKYIDDINFGQSENYTIYHMNIFPRFN